MSDIAVGGAFVSGLASGLIVKTGTAPFSRMTILLQVTSTNCVAESSFKRILRTWRHEGFNSFWKGNLISIVAKATLTAINYEVFERTKSLMRPFWKSEQDVGIVTRTFAGGIAGVASQTLAYPLDVVRTRLACDPTPGSGLGSNRFPSVWKEILRQQGWKGLYRGLPCTLLCQGINIGLNFGIYETLNVQRLKDGQRRADFCGSMCDGAVAGCLASSIVHPLDLIRRRQQMMTNSTPTSVLQIARIILKNDGVMGLYKGIVPELVKVAPAVGLNFYLYEWIRLEVMGLQDRQR